MPLVKTSVQWVPPDQVMEVKKKILYEMFTTYGLIMYNGFIFETILFLLHLDLISQLVVNSNAANWFSLP